VTVYGNSAFGPCTLQRLLHTDGQPQYVTGDNSGHVWVTCFSAQRVDQFSLAGVLLQSVNPLHSGPTGITYDAQGGLVWGATWSGYVYSITPNTGAVGNVTFRGGSNHGHYDILWPNVAGHLWATDFTGGQVNYLLE
jgi:streptogramin lyase